jgi:hypothetical protein
MRRWTIIWASAAEEESDNHRNGYGSKTVITDSGKLELSVPRDRHGRFDPVLIGKYRRRFALYARGMTTREIAEHIGELCGTEISASAVQAPGSDFSPRHTAPVRARAGRGKTRPCRPVCCRTRGLC